MSFNQYGPYGVTQTGRCLPDKFTRNKFNVDNGKWARNPSWPTLAAPLSSEQKIVALFAVYPDDGNFFAVNISTSSGTVSINLGDSTGTVTVSSATQYNYIYSYSDSALNGTNAPVTITASTDTIARTAHGYTDGRIVQLYSLSGGAGLSDSKAYYVVNATANDFQVSLTKGGSAINITSDGTAALLPYKVATVTITPTTSGANLTTCNLAVKHNQSGLVNGYTNGWLEIKYSILSTGIATLSSTASVTRSLMLEHVHMVQGRYAVLNGTCFALVKVKYDTLNVISNDMDSHFNNCYSLLEVYLPTTTSIGTSANAMFQNCYSLVRAPVMNTSAVTLMSSMFNMCYSLEYVPLYDSSSVTSMASMFSACQSLKRVPLFNTASVGSFQSMFSGAGALVEVPKFNCSSATTFNQMFSNCSNLAKVPNLNTTSSLTNTSSMFNGCNALTEAPMFDTSGVTTMASMFSTCRSLTTVPPYNTVSNTSFVSMFGSCSGLTTTPDFDCTAATTLASMFASCSSLIMAPKLSNTGSVTTVASMFTGCSSLRSIPLFDTSSCITFTSAFNTCGALEKLPAFTFAAVTTTGNQSPFVTTCTGMRAIEATGAKYTHTIANLMLGPAQLDAYYTGLGTAAGAQTLTVTGNWGTVSDTPSIATAKGWTVTGS